MKQDLKQTVKRVAHALTVHQEQVEAARYQHYARESFDLLADLTRELKAAGPRGSDPRRLLAYGYKGFSQGDEDGIIDEIFRRIGTTNRYFVEFGVGDGLQNNTVALLLAGWRGGWLEGNDANVARIREAFGPSLVNDALRLRQAFITAENIEALFAELGAPSEPDLLGIDIDGNDYWVWRAITGYRPRVVVVEYNAMFGRSARCVVPYRPDRVWDGSSHYGASLAALEALGREKGYTLVGCSFMGTNAFFVRDDLVGDHFCAPYTAANHFEPARYPFGVMRAGHPPAWGDVAQV